MKTPLKFLFYVMAVAFIATTSYSCSDDDDDDNDPSPYEFEHNGHTYQVIKERKTWADAAKDAVSKGGYLVEIGTQAEQDAVYQGIKDAGISSSYTKVNDGGGVAYVWIGATDKATEGEWLWNGKNASTGGTQFWKNGAAVNNSFVNWGGKSAGTFNEPDNFTDSSLSPNGQNAAAIGLAKWPAGSSTTLGNAGEWNDIAETNKLYYVIEIE